jgi:hypothetical protein
MRLQELAKQIIENDIKRLDKLKRELNEYINKNSVKKSI